MNISTGGPHILLFERDQQLAALLMSELQLAGYEGHTARTAVEVFDAIARYPVRLVLVNLAQAAAARREFWVALDSQRRGGSIQVLTFHCTNLAGYGPRDLEEHLATVADIELDGMVGMMKLLDIIRVRVPNIDINANTVPRMNRTTTSASAMSPRFTQPIPVPNITSNNGMISNGVAPRNAIPNDGNSQISSSRVSASPLSHTPPNVAPTPSIASQMHQTSQMPTSPSGVRNSQTAAYPDKIRAVIYPSQQRNWNASNPLNQEVGQPGYTSSQAHAHFASDTPVLQGLATGQLNGGTSGESGLAQLTRMVQASQVPDQGSQGQAVPPEDTYVLPTYTPPIARVGSASEAISSQVLRPAPIQDLPEERPVITSPLGTDVQRKPEVLSRANHHQPASAQAPSSTAQFPLASLSTSGMAANAMSTSARRETGAGPDQSVVSKDPQKSQENGTEARHVQEHPVNSSSERKQETYEVGGQDEEHNDDKGTRAEDSVILDILQSLPLMPAVGQQQALQPQVLNGRVTRSLGNVLLDGHLVPQERLQVAQNIQRMLRGVDLNYQLGEILLMFKLLTPDQLLAASLVSYGLITTTQVSAFGRIRQELHAIGLEYDLENLLVLFRVLTSEQLREARSQIQS